MTRTDAAHDIVRLARAALERAPAGLLCDLDGTLAPIAPRPDLARLEPGASEAVAALREKLAVVAVITGRAAVEARALIGNRGVLVVGNHGLEWLEPGADEPELPEAIAERLATVPALLEGALAAARERLRGLSGLVYEDKGVSGTIHYRLAAEPARARSEILAALDATTVPAALVVREGRMAVELRPRGVGDKGSALEAIVARHALRGILVFGDDLTDVDAFRAAAELRRGAGLAAFIGAVAGDVEVPDVVREAADAVLPSPGALVKLLAQLP